MAENLLTKDDVLNKLRAYAETPDDDNIKYKRIIHDKLLNCPELLYAIHNKELESELFDKDGNLMIDEDGNLTGDVDRYFGDNSNIRPFLYIPEAQTDTINYICYQVNFTETPKYNNVQKYTEITFTVFVHKQDTIDKLTGIPRHDLISSILREKFNWSNIFGMQAHMDTSRESITDANYLVRTSTLQITDLNGVVNTPYGGQTQFNNYQIRR